MKKIKVLIIVAAMLVGLCVGCDNDKKPVGGTTEATVTAVADSESTTAEDTADEIPTEKETEGVTTEIETTESSITETMSTETAPTATEGLFMIEYAEKILGNYSGYDEYVIDDTDPSIKALLYTDGVVIDLKFLSLTNPNVDDDGRMTFDKTELHSHKYITKDRPILITFTSYGEIPTYGVSVTDAVGDTVFFAITMSGEDGSLLLTEIG